MLGISEQIVRAAVEPRVLGRQLRVAMSPVVYVLVDLLGDDVDEALRDVGLVGGGVVM